MDKRLICLVVAAALSTVAWSAPPNMSLADYLARKKQISTEHRSAQTACGISPSIDLEVCLVEAMGRDSVAKADLEVAYRSTPRTRYEANEARAEARFWVAREQCADSAAPLRDACVRDAKAIRVAAQTNGALLLKAAEADRLLDDACADAAASAAHPRSHACALRAVAAATERPH